ncbi:MAG: M48 family metallopeptidase [Sulfuricurvum sp.]|nr:M48 family metallopeptidase [Sulfuricurvum sp.]
MILLSMFDASTSAIIIEYRPRNRNTYIRISHSGEIKVRTPLKNESAVRRILKLRERWIREKLEGLADDPDLPQLGESIRFRGENYTLENLPNLYNRVKNSQNSDDIKKYYYHFYKKEAEISLPSRVQHYARKMDLQPKEIRFRRMKSRWGSCDSHGVVTFNTMMMQLSYEQIDYIIVHELAHLRHMNHSKEFHELVRHYLSDEQERRKTLRRIRPLVY